LSVAPVEYDPGLRAGIIDDFRFYIKNKRRFEVQKAYLEQELGYLKRELRSKTRQLDGSHKRNVSLRHQLRNDQEEESIDLLKIRSSLIPSVSEKQSNAVTTPHHEFHAHGKVGKSHRSRKRKYRDQRDIVS